MKGGELSPHIHGFSVNNRTDLPRVVAIGVATGLLYLILLITPLLLHLGPYIPQGLALIGPIRRSGEGMRRAPFYEYCNYGFNYYFLLSR